MRVFLLFLSMFLFGNDIIAQIRCGTPDRALQPIDQAKLEVYKNKILEKSLDVDSVAVAFHIINDAIQVSTIEKEIRFLNKYFADANIFFFSCGEPTLRAGQISYDYEQGDALNQKYQIPNTINVYYVQVAEDLEGNQLCGYAYFPGIPASQRYAIIASDPYCLAGGSTLAHELGHFYGLPHTHSVQGGEELVDGSNCRTAGDGFCDTPADPNLNSDEAIIRDCIYLGDQRDASGDLYMPNVNNLMSYAPPVCTNEFSIEQLALVRLVHEFENSYILDNCVLPDFKALAKTTSEKFRFNDAISIDYEFENLGLQEEFDVPVFIYLSENRNRQGSIIKKDTFLFSPFAGNELISFNLNLPVVDSRKYYLTLSIDPNAEFNEVDRFNNISTSQIEIDNSALESELIFPNPSSGLFKLFLRDSKLTGELLISIYDTDGRLIKTIDSSKIEEEYVLEVDISDLREGLYFVEIYSNKFDVRKTFKVYKSL